MEKRNDKQPTSPETVAEEQAAKSSSVPASKPEETKEKKPVQSASDQSQSADAKDVEKNKAITFLSYLGLLFLVPLLVAKESKFAQFHAKQGLVLTIGWFLGFILMPLLGIGILVELAIIVLSIIGLVNVAQGKMEKLPLVGNLAEKFNI